MLALQIKLHHKTHSTRHFNDQITVFRYIKKNLLITPQSQILRLLEIYIGAS